MLYLVRRCVIAQGLRNQIASNSQKYNAFYTQNWQNFAPRGNESMILMEKEKEKRNV